MQPISKLVCELQQALVFPRSHPHSPKASNKPSQVSQAALCHDGDDVHDGQQRQHATGIDPAPTLEPQEQPLPLQHASGGRAGRERLRAAAGLHEAAAQGAPSPGGDGTHQPPHPRRGELGASARDR
ncbi:hypothetical protein GQ600_25745 [Phytophthora cactorum]|nr:hypothetical protein GQ600_25745 [Phytophthora cactorum]